MAYYPFSKQAKEYFSIKPTSGYGWRVIDGKRSFHDGEDYAPMRNKDSIIYIIASVDGDLLNGKDNNNGLYQVVRDVKGISYMTVHQERFLIGDSNIPKGSFRYVGKVKAGQKIGIMGTTGLSTGKHVHFEMDDTRYGKALDPSKQSLTLFDDIKNMEEKFGHPNACIILRDTRVLKDYRVGGTPENTLTTGRKGHEFDAVTWAKSDNNKFYSFYFTMKGKEYKGYVNIKDVRHYPTSDLASRHRIIELDRENRELKANESDSAKKIRQIKEIVN